MNVFEIEQKSINSNQNLEDSDFSVRSTNFQTLIKLLKVCIGSGIFAIPYAYSQSGLISGICLQILILLFTYKSWCTLVECIGENDRVTLIQYITNKYGQNSYLQIICTIFTIIYNFGGGVSYIILFNQVIFQTIDSKAIYIQIILAIMMLITQLIASFYLEIKKFQLILSGSVILMFITILYLISLTFYSNGDWISNSLNLQTVMIAFGIDLFSYDINGIITEIKAEMQNPGEFKQILFGSMIIETILFGVFGIICSMSYGGDTNQIILNNFQIQFSVPPQATILKIILISYVCTLLVSNWVISIPSYLLLKKHIQNHIYQNICKICYIISQLFLSFLFPNFAIILSVFGCICSVTLGYIIPFILSINHDYSKKKRIINIIVVSFGIIGGIIGLVTLFISN